MSLAPSGDSSGLCGFLVLDKPAGITSHGCVAAVRRAYGLRRVGHGGTLDPAVTGVLPIAVGPATRLLPYLEGSKAYRGTVQLGVCTSSDDLEGDVLQYHPLPILEPAEIEAALQRFRGPILQIPPQVSAVHVDGERAHTRARRGETMQLQPRPVTIEQLDLLGWDPASGRIELAVRCTAGTYIRSLARDLGESLGCGGALASLRRTEALGFDLGNAVSMERLSAAPRPALQNPLRALAHLDQHQLSSSDLGAWRCGRPLLADPAANGGASEPVAVIDPDGQLAGIALSGPGGELRPRLVLNATG